MGVGFAKDGESRNKQNAGLRNRLKEKYFLKQEYKISNKVSLHFREASPNELNQIRSKLDMQKRATRKRSFLVLTVLVLFIIYLVFF